MRHPTLYLAPALILAFGASALCAQDAVPRYPRMYSVNYIPYIEDTGEYLWVYGNWGNPVLRNRDFVADLSTSSHGLLNFRQSTEVGVDEYPMLSSGERYDDDYYTYCYNHWNDGYWYTAGVDYKMLTVNYDFARRVDFGEVDEVNNNCAPYFGYWETTFCGYGGYWCNSMPQQRVACSKLFVIFGLNYERGIAEMLESNGHRFESIMRYVYGSWDMASPDHLWDEFTLNYGNSHLTQSVFAIGNIHYPPNGQSDYDYANTLKVSSNAHLWLTMGEQTGDFPDLTGGSQIVDRETWGGTDYHRNYLNWFYYHVPHFGGTNSKNGYTRLNNWWEYTNNFNLYPESGGDHPLGGDPPPAQPSPLTVVRLTDNTLDEWRPQVNANGDVIWFETAQGRGYIHSGAADGGGVLRIAGGRPSELPRINSSGQAVWQQFDGKTFEIYTGVAGVIGSVAVTSNAAGHCWHPDINDSGRIVWEAFDGEDYEIFSANVDGSDVVQITDNTNSGVGRPRDDMWPRINNSNRVVWMGHDGSNWEIYSANADGTGLLKVSSNSYENEYPEIGDSGVVVWHAWASTTNGEVFKGNAYASGNTRLSTNTVHDWWPQVNANGDVVWMRRVSGDWEIILNGTAITSNSQHDQHPVIDDNGRVAWQGFDGSDWEIYYYENGVIYQLTDNDYDDRAPQIATNGPIVWHGEAGTRDTIPTSEIFAAITPFALGDLNCDGAVNAFDIDPFVMALVAPADYAAAYPNCDVMLADANDDGAVNAFDIDPFVQLLVGG